MSDAAMFNAHCLALGRLCVAWAVVDRQLNDVLAAVLGCSASTAACIATSADSVAARCEIMRRVVHEDAISEQWIRQFEETLKRLASDLGARRNRFVHDYWPLTNGTLRTMDRRAVARRAQSRSPIKVEYDIEHVTAPGAVDHLTTDIGEVAFLLHCAMRDLKDWKQHKRHVLPPLLSRALDLPDLPDALQTLRE